MNEVVSSIDISRTPEDVFAYATDFAQFGHWQDSVASVTLERSSPVRIGSEAIVTRRVGPRRVRATEQITKLTPPSNWEVRGVGGVPVTAIATGKIEPLDGGNRSRVTISLGFEGHGIGKLLIPLVIRRQARRQLPQNTARLKHVLEHEA
jgi:carbon monoxide dehydrogenase subunit G